eukprot:6675171-Prymnesium_polylepis.1
MLLAHNGRHRLHAAVRARNLSNFVTALSGLQYRDTLLPASDARVAQRGDNVSVHYTGTLADGTVFDTSLSDSLASGQRRAADGTLLTEGQQGGDLQGWERGIPFQFSLGAGEVIPGWDEGICGMGVGGKRELIVPPHMAYGNSGAGDKIPPGAALHFEVELLDAEEASGLFASLSRLLPF